MKFLIPFLLVTLSLPAFANVRVIGNGGGVSEMQLLTEFSTIKKVLLLAANNEDLVPTPLRSTLNQALFKIPSEWALKFMTTGPLFSNDIFNNKTLINLKALEESQLRTDHILAQALLAATEDLNNASIASIVNTIFPAEGDWMFESERFGTNQLMVFKNSHAIAASIQGRKQWTSLKSLLEPNCQDQLLSLIAIEGLRRSSQGFEMQLQWQCDSSSKGARARLVETPDGWQLLLFAGRG